MTIINIDVPVIPTGAIAYGPYEVSHYLEWQTDLANNVTVGSEIKAVKTHYGIWFIEILKA